MPAEYSTPCARSGAAASGARISKAVGMTKLRTVIGEGLQKDEEERLKRAARATMMERVLLKLAEAAGAALAGYIMKMVGDRLLGGAEAKEG